jgi:CheY-like chemotaxis protein
MDVQMPVMDGLQATAAIRELDDVRLRELTIIAMTAHAMQGDREACLAAGMDSYIAKPLDNEKLIEMIESVVYETESEMSQHPEQKIAASGQPESPEISACDSELVDVAGALRRLGGDRDLLYEFIIIFLEDSPQLMKLLEDAVHQAEAPAIVQHAHAVKGLASNFGAKPFVDSALQLEKLGRDGELSDVRSEYAVLEKTWQDLCQELVALQNAKRENSRRSDTSTM